MSMFYRDEACILQREYVNIPAWHTAGYRGRGQAVLLDDIGGNHAECVADIIEVIAPEAKVFRGTLGYRKEDEKIVSCIVKIEDSYTLLDEFIQTNQIGYMNNSKDFGGHPSMKDNAYAIHLKEQIKKYNLITTASAGNVPDGYVENAWHGAAMLINSAGFSKGGKVVHQYSSIGEYDIDFAMFHGFQSGTSFAAPFFLGMCILLRCKYPKFTQAEVHSYFKKHAEKIEDPKYSGWGLPRLGDPLQI